VSNETAAEGDWQTYAGISVVAFAAAVMSFAAWSELGALVGITQTLGHKLYLAWLLPVSVDAYAVTTARVWLRSTTASDETRGFARRSSLAAIGLSIAGNGLYHFIVAVHMTRWPWWPLIVVLVSGIPALQLGLALHLAALVGRDRRQATSGPSVASRAVVERVTTATGPAVRPAGQKPVRRSEQKPAKRAGQVARKATGQKPVRTPEQVAEQTPGQTSGQTSGQVHEQTSGQMPEQKPQSAPNRTPPSLQSAPTNRSPNRSAPSGPQTPTKAAPD